MTLNYLKEGITGFFISFDDEGKEIRHPFPEFIHMIGNEYLNHFKYSKDRRGVAKGKFKNFRGNNHHTDCCELIKEARFSELLNKNHPDYYEGYLDLFSQDSPWKQKAWKIDDVTIKKAKVIAKEDCSDDLDKYDSKWRYEAVKLMKEKHS